MRRTANPDRAKLEAAMAEFEAKGGQVQRLPPNASATPLKRIGGRLDPHEQVPPARESRRRKL